MTMVGGKIVQLQESLANAFGVDQVGPVQEVVTDEQMTARYLGDN